MTETMLSFPIVAPSRGRGSKPQYDWVYGAYTAVAPSRGRGSKHPGGAGFSGGGGVAPSRGRGSKRVTPKELGRSNRCRPFTGAWIETIGIAWERKSAPCRPFTGAWIETSHLRANFETINVAPSRGRGSKRHNEDKPGFYLAKVVAPSRGRGSKRHKGIDCSRRIASPLHGGVDRNVFPVGASVAAQRRPFTGAWIETLKR